MQDDYAAGNNRRWGRSIAAAMMALPALEDSSLWNQHGQTFAPETNCRSHRILARHISWRTIGRTVLHWFCGTYLIRIRSRS